MQTRINRNEGIIKISAIYIIRFRAQIQFISNSALLTGKCIPGKSILSFFIQIFVNLAKTLGTSFAETFWQRVHTQFIRGVHRPKHLYSKLRNSPAVLHGSRNDRRTYAPRLIELTRLYSFISWPVSETCAGVAVVVPRLKLQ